MSVTQRSPFTLVVTLLGLVFLYLPLVMVVLFSFHATGAISFPFTGFSLRWYRETLGDEIFRDTLWNSTVVAISVPSARGTHSTTIIAAPALSTRRASCSSAAALSGVFP